MQTLGDMADDNNNGKKPPEMKKDNLIFFPFHKIKDLKNARKKPGPEVEKQVKQIHNQIYVQQCVDDICTVVMRYLFEEKVQLHNPILMKDFKLYRDYGGKKDLRDYMRSFRALRFLHKEGGRVPLGAGGLAGMLGE